MVWCGNNQQTINTHENEVASGRSNVHTVNVRDGCVVRLLTA